MHKLVSSAKAATSALALLSAMTVAAAPSVPPLAAYGNLPLVKDMAISSTTGDKIAVVATVKGKPRVIVIDSDNRQLLNIPAGDSKLRGIDWAGDDFVLVTKSTTASLGPMFTASKYEFNGTIVLPIDGSKAQFVFGGTKGIANTTQGRYGLRKIDGEWKGYFGGIALDTDGLNTRWRHGRPTLYGVDLATNRARIAAAPASENHFRDWLVDENGEIAVTLDVNRNNGKWQITNEHHDKLAEGVDPTGDISLICFGKDGSSFLYSTEDDNEGVTHWFEVPLAGGDAVEVLPDTRVERLYIDKRNSRLLGYLPGGAEPKPVFFDPERQKAADKIYRAFGKWHATLIDYTPDMTHAIVHTSGNKDSGTWFRVDVANLKADAVSYDRDAILPDAVGPISTVEYKAADGLEMDGILTLPPGREAKNLPVIMLPHGGPTAHDEPGFDWWAQAFASRGYAVFQPNFRGSTNRDDAFRRAGYGQWGRKMQTDISDGLNELVRQGIADPKRACIVGASYGGYAALAGVTLQHGIYRCAVSVAGVADVELMYNTDVYESGGTRMTRKSLRESLGNPKEFDSISPRRFADQADAPVLLIHGKDDTVVPFKQSAVMADALKDAHKPYEMVVLKHEDHWLSQSDTRLQMLTAAMRFVQKYNPAD
ncbi:alpha/beta hydrolase family protein [Novosphingobium beihaiensis]|uniref:S9 family peptidase n=1 Tax=Novosphingobium beihaiensis TaxID=2930389 RepID=A0ABT0BJZ1_9SPHN|nr:S9 family peptidase [Novosphingobium beihaiensis]MCJ2185360.1 S9 family peptidase [Novosphingobium beihaiensis]